MSLSDLQEPLHLLEQKEFAPAVEVLERKVASLPAHLGAYVLLAHAYEAQERWTQALQTWGEVHLLMPNSPLADDGKRRVLRRMDGIEVDGDRTAPAPSPSPEDSEAEGEASATDEPDAGGAEHAIPTTEASPSDEDQPDDESLDDESLDDESGEDKSGEETPPELAQLREQAEQEARQGGARANLGDEPPPADPSPDAEPTPPDEPSTTPEEQIEAFEDEEDEDSLDQLINELESARIEPEPEADPDDDPPSDPSVPKDKDETEGVVSETLARIHETQEDYETAAHIYEQLAEQEPSRADEFQNKAAEMRAKTDETER